MVAELDLAFAKAKYADDLRAIEPRLEPIRGREGTRHPGQLDPPVPGAPPAARPATVVPIDVELDPQTYAMIVTGPNTGGKTVTLKTVGLLAVMAQAGCTSPPISGSELSLFKRIFADIGDEQSIEQSLSTFSGHITNIIRILQAGRPPIAGHSG